ncbi:MAG: hypothetical protein KKA71_02575, partial [Proteobacteria bacterium]|nr:hypothetical protein [Pseudomonadota bacterium]
NQNVSSTTGKAGGLTVAGPSKGPATGSKQSLVFSAVIPAKAGIQTFSWIPAFAGMTCVTETMSELSNFASPPAEPGV